MLLLTLHELFFVACDASITDFGNNVLKIVNDFRLPSAPESVLYMCSSLTGT